MASNLQFLSWSRRGIGASTPVGQAGSRLLVTTRVTVTGDRKDAPQLTQSFDSAPMAVLGPGDVTGLDPTQVVRRTPRPGDHQLEPNYLAAIEFAHPDLPWMFSPSGAVGERADPWLMLVVLNQEPGQVQGIVGSSAGSPCPVLVLGDPDAVPNPTDAWAFAHVQVHDVDADGAKAVVSSTQPQVANVRSRLICPTHLAPDTAYVAAVVPVYEAGRRVGLGQPETDAGSARWVAAGGLKLPVYDFWKFRTGPSGDFESLARKLAPIDLSNDAQLGEKLKNLGLREVLIESKAALLQTADSPDLFAAEVHQIPTAIARDDVPGALSPNAPTPSAAAQPLQTRIKELVDIVAAATDAEPIVGPPLYGRWPAEATSLDGQPETSALATPPDGVAQTWIEQLNADPYLRSPAGVATLLVQRDQEPLMTDAWSQLSEVLAANRRMRWSHLYAMSVGALHTKLAAAPAAGALRLTSPSLGRLRADAGITVRAQLDASTLPREALGSAIVRVAGYATKVALRDAAHLSVTAAVDTAAEALRISSPAAIPTRFSSTRLVDMAALTAVLGDTVIAGELQQRLGTDPASYLQQVDRLPDTVIDIASKVTQVPGVQGQVDGPVVQIDPGLRDRVVMLSRVAIQLDQAGTVPLAASVRADLTAFQAGNGASLSLGSLSTLSQLAGNRRALSRVRGFDLTKLTRLDLSVGRAEIGISTRLTGSLGSLAIAAGLGEQSTMVVSATDGLRTAALSGLGIAAPSITDIVGRLTDNDTALLTGGVKQLAVSSTPLSATAAVPEVAVFSMATATNVVAVLEPKAAYEKLLTYAHSGFSDRIRRRPGSQFHPAMASPHFPAPLVDKLKTLDEEWVLGGVKNLPPNSVCVMAVNWRFVEAFLAGANHEMARELLWRGYPTDLRGSCFQQFWPAATPDISSMDSWRGPIGSHPVTGVRKEITMVVIKGDLLRRYPATLITAERGTTAAFSGDTQFTSDNLIAQQLFRGFLGEDVTYAALDISLAELTAELDDNRRHAWYISLLEPHDEPRFGMDEGPASVVAGSNASPLVAGAFDYKITDDWSWQGRPDPQARHLDPASVRATGGAAESSAVVGASLFQIPFRLLLRAPDYLPPEA